MSSINCFWLEPTDKIRRSLLVIALNSECKARSPGVCRHQIFKSEHPAIPDGHGGVEWIDVPDPAPDSHEWPRRCEFCDEPFSSNAMYSSIQELIYVASDGNRYTVREAPLGAMWNEPDCIGGSIGADGNCICVKTPGGVWCVDGRSWKDGKVHNERPWTRTGTPPKITVHPSIHIKGADEQTIYHGWLREGVLTEV